MYQQLKELEPDDRIWFCVFVDTLDSDALSSWAETSDGAQVFQELKVFVQHSLDVNLLILGLRALANLEALQPETQSTSAIGALSLHHNDRLSGFDSIIKDVSFDKSKTISKHIYPLALDAACSVRGSCVPYVQAMLGWHGLDPKPVHHSEDSSIRRYWLSRYQLGLSHQDALDKVRATS